MDWADYRELDMTTEPDEPNSESLPKHQPRMLTPDEYAAIWDESMPLTPAVHAAKWHEFWRLFYELASQPDEEPSTSGGDCGHALDPSASPGVPPDHPAT
jgi:hypothetical protein